MYIKLLTFLENYENTREQFLAGWSELTIEQKAAMLGKYYDEQSYIDIVERVQSILSGDCSGRCSGDVDGSYERMTQESAEVKVTYNARFYSQEALGLILKIFNSLSESEQIYLKQELYRNYHSLWRDINQGWASTISE